MNPWWYDIALGVAANLVFAVLLGALAGGLGVYGQRRLLRMLGASRRCPRVEIILSNVPVKGAPGNEPLTKGYVGGGFAQAEVEAAHALRDRLTKAFVPLAPDLSLGGLRLRRVEVTIRPGLATPDEEVDCGFILANNKRPITRAIVVIGSPVYNSAALAILGPTVVINDGKRIGLEVAPPSPRSHSLLLWTIDVASLNRRWGLDKWWVEYRYPRGVRSFRPVADPPVLSPVMGRAQETRPAAIHQWMQAVLGALTGTARAAPIEYVPQRVWSKTMHEQSLVQQICLPDPSGTRWPLKQPMTITLFAGVGSGGTAAAVKAFLIGDRNWRWLRRHRVRGRRRSPWTWLPFGRHSPVAWAYFWSRLVTDSEPDIVDFNSKAGLNRDEAALMLPELHKRRWWGRAIVVPLAGQIPGADQHPPRVSS